MKPRLHFHSDCAFFAGCENMLVNFFDSEELAENFELSFSYRKSPAYDEGLKSRIKKVPEETFPLPLFDFNQFMNKFGKLLFPMNLVLKVLFHLIGLKFLIILWNTFLIIKYFKGRKIDILHLNNGGYPGAYSQLSFVLASFFLKVNKIVMVVNNIAVNYKNPTRWPDFFLDRLIIAKVDFFLTGSKNAAKKLSENLKVSSQKTKTIPNGIRPRPVEYSREVYRKKHGIDNDVFIFGMIAVFEKRKGHQILVKALHELQQREGTTNFKVILEGTGPTLEQIKGQVVSLGLNEQVRFIENEPSIFSLINAIDVLLLPSISHEDFPNIILEAMERSKPTISTSIAGIPEQIENGVDGIIVKPGDSHQLAQAMDRVIEDPQIVHQMSLRAKQKFEAYYHHTKSVSRYLNLYQSLLQEHAK